MEQILEIDNTDDITSIRSRIEFALSNLTQQSGQPPGSREQPRLLLVIPRKNKALHSLVNMKLLARTVKARAVEMAIVSAHPTVRDYAKEAGLKTFGSLRRAKWAGWATRQTPVASAETTLPPVVTPPEGGPAQESTKKTPKRAPKKKYRVVSGSERSGVLWLLTRQLGALVLVVVLALALVAGVIVLLPQATVTITPVAQPVEASLVVKADPNAQSVNFQELTFPARIDQVELELSGQIETVETELAPTGRATGRVIFINRTEEEQTIPVSTTLATSAGQPVEFTTAETSTIPAGLGEVSTPTQVIAVEPGPNGNVPVGQINRFVEPAYARLARIVNEEPTTGGTLEPAKIVVQSDKERLVAHLRQKVQQEGLAQLQDSLGEQEFIPPESVQVIVLDVKYQEFSGDFSDTFSGEMQAVVRATVIGGYNANRLALAALQAQVPPRHELDLDGLNFSAGEVLGIEEGVVSFRVFARGQAIPVIDGQEIAQDIAWLPIGQAQARLNQQYRLATVPGVELQPDWLVNMVGRLPFAPIRINVVINDAITLMAEGS